jgi:formylglycine-generating enzyme required for sulfatase activity
MLLKKIRAWVNLILLCTLATLAIHPAAHAQTVTIDLPRSAQTSISKRVALVVGNSAYADRPLRNAVNDAGLMQLTLRSIGFDVQLVLNGNRSTILGALRDFEARANDADVALFFFAGHGAQAGGGNFLIPVNAPIRTDNDLPDEAIAAETVLRRIEGTRARVGLVILDACRDNPYPGSQRSGARGLSSMSAPSGTIVAYATAPGNTADDGDGANGVYSGQLARFLIEPGLDVKEVFEKTAIEVERLTRGRQRPREDIGLRGRFELVSGARVAAQPSPSMGVVQSAGPTLGQTFRDCADCPEMVVVPAGSFTMGSPPSEAGRLDNEGPQHIVAVKSVAFGKTHITRGQFAAFVNATNYDAGNECFTFEGGKGEKRSGRHWRNPGYQQGDSHPVVCISWEDAKAYAKWLSSKTDRGYRLPTEAEWEYAARAGTTTARYWGDSADQACGYANVLDATAKSQVPAVTWEVHNCTDGYAYTAPAGSFRPNVFGLQDTIGNAWQWVEDCWHDDYSGAPTDGTAWMKGGNCGLRVLRGGSWGIIPQYARFAVRDANTLSGRNHSNGFRLARTLP